MRCGLRTLHDDVDVCVTVNLVVELLQSASVCCDGPTPKDGFMRRNVL